ncbi:MAG: DUF1559 domain-containing protein [Planctomycetaceae bacterium]|nr:DUF1559 domain-containing protein [Planctomycetaceae bacterium]
MSCDRQFCFMPSRSWRWASFVLALFAFGELSATASAQPAAKEADAGNGFNLKNVPAATNVLLGVRPAQLARRPELIELVKLLDNSAAEAGQGWRAEDFDQVLMLLLPSTDGFGFGGQPVFEIRMTKPSDLEAPIKQMLGGGEISLQSAGDEAVWARSNQEMTSYTTVAYAIDSRSFLMGPSQEVLKFVRLKQQREKPPFWIDQFEQVAHDDVCAVVNMSYYRPLIQGVFAADPNPLLGMFVPLWENTDLIVGGGRFEDHLSLTVDAWTKNAASATKVEERLRALIPLASGLLESSRVSLDRAPQESRGILEQAIELGELALEKLTIEQVEDRVTLTVKTDAGSLAQLVAAILPTVKEARDTARGTQSKNNLKQIGLAFHNYHDVYNSFPPPVLIGPDGKTEVSWRVAVLPYIGEQQLYEEYDQSQPWDSEKNRKVLARMPSVFRSPMDTPDSTNASYFVLVGDDTAVGNQDGEGVGIRDITDGTSNTFLTVEAKRDIPWTKPVDIPYDPDKDVPKFGGWHEGGFHAGTADGAVRFYSEDLPAEIIRLLTTRNDGEVIPDF